MSAFDLQTELINLGFFVVEEMAEQHLILLPPHIGVGEFIPRLNEILLVFRRTTNIHHTLYPKYLLTSVQLDTDRVTTIVTAHVDAQYHLGQRYDGYVLFYKINEESIDYRLRVLPCLMPKSRLTKIEI